MLGKPGSGPGKLEEAAEPTGAEFGLPEPEGGAVLVLALEAVVLVVQL